MAGVLTAGPGNRQQAEQQVSQSALDKHWVQCFPLHAMQSSCCAGSSRSQLWDHAGRAESNLGFNLINCLLYIVQLLQLNLQLSIQVLLICGDTLSAGPQVHSLVRSQAFP